MKITENFSLKGDPNLLCRCCSRTKVTDLFYLHMDKLQKLRDECGPLIINSGYRCPAHNQHVGGAKESMHLDFATDVRPLRTPLKGLQEAAEGLGFTGRGLYTNFLHVDCRAFLSRPEAFWDNT